MRSIRVTLTLALAGAAALVPAQQAAATVPHISGPIVAYKCPPAPLWCTRTIKAGKGGYPGVMLTHIRARMRSGPTQDIYKLSWQLGDPHARLFAEALNPPSSNGTIQLGTISRWASWGAPAGFLGAINGDFFSQVGWTSGHPSGMLVRGRHVVAFGSGGPGVGYKADGRMVMGTPTARPVKLLLRNGRTATIAAFDPGSSLTSVKGDQVVVKTVHGAPVNVPAEWSGYLVGSSAQRTPFGTMLRGTRTLANATGNGKQEPVAGFRFGDGNSVVETVTVPIVPAPSPTVTLAPGQMLLMARSDLLADRDLQLIATHSQQVRITVDATAWSTVQDVMGGKPQLVKNGVVSYPKAGYDPPMMSGDGWQWDYPHWRPAVAESKTRGWMIITGGVRYGDGVYGWNWGKMLVQLGARNAMGFDNNSSTELYVPGRGTWSFSPAWERDVTEATALAYR